MSLKDKGFSYAAIDKALQLSGVDSQIASAQKAQYQNMFLNAMKQGDWGSAGMALANLAGIDKAGASMLGAYYPSYKDNWTEGNKRQDAKTNFGYQQRMAKQKHIYGQEDMRTKAQLQTMANAKILQDKAAIEQNAKLAYAKQLISMGVPQEQVMAMLTGGARKSSAGTTSSGAKSSDGNVYTVNGQPVKMSSKDIELKNQLENSWKYAWDSVNDPSNIALNGGDGGADDVDKFTRLVIDNKDKMSPEAYSHYYSLAAATQFLREKGAGHENKAAELWEQISPEVKEQYLSQY